MNIGYIVEMYTENARSGIEVWTRRLADYFSTFGIETTIHSYSNGLNTRIPTALKKMINVRELLVYPYVGWRNIPGKIEQQHDLIHYAAPFSRAWHRTRVPGLVSTHYIISRQVEMLSQYLPAKYKLFFNPLTYASYVTVEKMGFQRADMITVCREAYKEYIVERMGVPAERIVVVKYGIDPEKFKPQFTQPKIENVALYVGRGSLPKGFDTLVEAAQWIKGKVIAISSRVPAELVAKAKAAGNVEIKTGIPEKELTEIYRNASVFVMPSLTEGAPLSTLEAMASGLPVVCTVEGSGEYIKDGYSGYLFDFQDARALAERVNYLFAHPELGREFGIRNRNKVETELTLPVIANQILDVYKKMI